MIEKFFEIIGLVSVAAGASYLALKYLSQKLFEDYLSKSLERYKSQLEKEVITHQIQFSSLHKERADATRDIFTSINNLGDDTARFTVTFNKNQFGGVNLNNYQTHLLHLDEVLKSYNSIIKLIGEKEIYFSSVFVESIHKSCRKFAEISMEIGREIESNISKLTNDSFFKPEFFEEKNDSLDFQILELKVMLRTEFRMLIGVI